MSKYPFLLALVGTLLLIGGVSRTSAQTLLKITDDVILITAKGQNKKTQAQAHQHLAGAGESALPAGPGADVPRLGEPAVIASRPGVITAAAAPPGQRFEVAPAPRIAPPSSLPAQKMPLYGPLELQVEGGEGPANGLTLDQAIDQLVHTNYDLLTKFQEIPKAEADILSAGLRLNPFLFASTDGIPYGNYTPQRPGANSYEATLAQPIDVNQKRKIRIRLAQQARHVLEAQYQDAVRMQIDNLYTAFVDVLAARQTVRSAQAGLAGLRELVRITRDMVAKGAKPKYEIDRVMIQQNNAEVALREDEVVLAQARRNLATLLAIPPEQADALQIRGTLRDTSPPLPSIEELIQISLQVRPDLMSYRLGVTRAATAVQLARAERFEDVFLFFTPATYTNNGPQGGQNTTAWSAGVLLPLPIFNRNQGNIQRARVNVTQTQIELEGVARQVANQVQQAVAEYVSSRGILERYEQNILPAARRLRDERFRLFVKGQAAVFDVLEAQREYNDVVRQYLGMLVRHRRNMLHLNTAVGQRVTP